MGLGSVDSWVVFERSKVFGLDWITSEVGVELS